MIDQLFKYDCIAILLSKLESKNYYLDFSIKFIPFISKEINRRYIELGYTYSVISPFDMKDYMSFLIRNIYEDDEATENIQYTEYLDAFWWLFKSKWCCDHHPVDYITKKGDFQLLCIMLKNGCPYEISNLEDFAIDHEWTELIEWLCDNKFPKSSYATDLAIEYKDLDLLKWFFEKGYPISNCNAVCRSYGKVDDKNIEILKWLLEKGYKWETNEDRVSGFNGLRDLSSEKLLWILQSGYPLTDGDSGFSCINDIDVLERVRQEDPYSNSLKMLKWMNDNGYEITKKQKIN